MGAVLVQPPGHLGADHAGAGVGALERDDRGDLVRPRRHEREHRGAIDAAVVARVCDGAIMVVEQGGVGARMIVEHKKQLEASGVRILGAVLNKVKMSNSGYYGHYYKKYYGKYYTNEPDKKGKKRKKSR